MNIDYQYRMGILTSVVELLLHFVTKLPIQQVLDSSIELKSNLSKGN